MRVTLLGTGTPGKDLNCFQSSALVEVGSDLLLFDAGRGAVHQLVQCGVRVRCLLPERRRLVDTPLEPPDVRGEQLLLLIELSKMLRLRAGLRLGLQERSQLAA